jgi:hypothetical protein
VTSASAAKRTRRGTVRGLTAVPRDEDADMDADIDVDGDDVDGDRDADADIDADADDTPALSETASLSPISSPSPSPSPPPVSISTPPPRRLTKRERKAAGLPRQRGSAGKIVIPGGRFRAGDAPGGARVDAEGEWVRNGTGRVDVRGFRELRI